MIIFELMIFMWELVVVMIFVVVDSYIGLVVYVNIEYFVKLLGE